MKFSQIFQILEIRNRILNQKLPIKTSYKFNRFFSAIEKEAKFFNEELQKIIEEYGKRDENGNYIFSEDKNSILIVEEKKAECVEKTRELNELEVDLDYIPSFNLEELENLDLTVREIELLMPYIQE